MQRPGVTFAPEPVYWQDPKLFIMIHSGLSCYPERVNIYNADRLFRGV